MSEGKVINGRCNRCDCLIANPNEITEENGIIYHAFNCSTPKTRKCKQMGYPLPQDIKWICDSCKKQIDYSEAIFPNPNKTECYHKNCIINKHTTLLNKGKEKNV